jgi:lysozyme family protein
MITATHRFYDALKIVLDHEGGYSNDLHDKGGETKYGISKRFIVDNNIKPPSFDMKKLTKDDAVSIYKCYFWDKNNFEGLDDEPIRNKLFDLSVNMGAGTAIKLFQKSLSEVNHRSIVEDGNMGLKTLALANTTDDQKLLLETFINFCCEYYKAIVARHPEQVKFLKGWLNRCES